MNAKKYLAIFAAMAMLVSLSACSNMIKTDRVDDVALFSGNTISLKIDNHQMAAPPADGIQYFYSKTRIEDLVKLLSGMDGIDNVAGYSRQPQIAAPSSIFFSVADPARPDGVNDVYAIDEWPISQTTKYGHEYRLLSLTAICRFEDNNDQHYSPLSPTGILFLLPLHLISDSRLTFTRLPVLLENVEYETIRSIDEFYDFYVLSGWYDIAKEKNDLVIKGYKQTPRSIDNPGDSFALPFPIKIVFTEHVGQTFFSIQKELN